MIFVMEDPTREPNSNTSSFDISNPEQIPQGDKEAVEGFIRCITNTAHYHAAIAKPLEVMLVGSTANTDEFKPTFVHLDESVYLLSKLGIPFENDEQGEAALPGVRELEQARKLLVLRTFF